MSNTPVSFSKLNVSEVTTTPCMQSAVRPPTTADNESWLREWYKIQQFSPREPQAPSAARQIHTPLIHSRWSSALVDYLHQPTAEFLLSGILQGFRIGFNYTQGSLKLATENLNCALQHKEVVDEYLQSELSHN